MTTINRRTAMLGTVTLPVALAPAAGYVQAADITAEPNATDAAWAELEAADAAFTAAYEEWEAFDDWIVAQIGPQPAPFINMAPGEYSRKHKAWEKARAQLPENPHEHPAEGEPLERLNAARDALVGAPVATLIDLERKLSVAFHVDDDRSEAAFSQTILEGVAAMLGRAA